MPADGELQRVRIGLLDRKNNFSLEYEEGESESTVFPGEFLTM